HDMGVGNASLEGAALNRVVVVACSPLRRLASENSDITGTVAVEILHPPCAFKFEVRPAGRDREVRGVVGFLAIFTAQHLLLVAVPSQGQAVRFSDCIGSSAPPKSGGDDGSRTAGPSERARRISPSAPERRRTVGCKMTRSAPGDRQGVGGASPLR